MHRQTNFITHLFLFITLIQQNTADYFIVESIFNEFATISKLPATRLPRKMEFCILM